MRILPGLANNVAQESISSRLLIKMGVNDPDFIPTIMRAYPEEAPVIALLDAKGYKTTGLNYATNWNVDQGRYRTVSSNHIQYRIAQNDMRREQFAMNSDGIVYLDDAYTLTPGLNKNPFYVYADSNFAGQNDVILLADGVTQLFIKEGPKGVSGGVFEYLVVVDGDNLDEYCDPDLLKEGYEFQVATTKFPQDFSRGGNERYSFEGFGDAYLTLQRLKYSWSGTAAAMDKNNKMSGYWVQNGNSKEKAFLTYAENQMMKYASRFLNFQLLEGKKTITTDTKKVVLNDIDNQEILSGSGIMYANDGAIEFPMNNGWSKAFIEALLTDIHTYLWPNENGEQEAMLLLHPRSYLNFNTTMSDMGVTADSNIEGVGGEKMIINAYRGYQLGNVKLYVTSYKGMAQRPSIPLADGSRNNEWDGIIVPMGRTPGGDRGIELVQLRPMVEGTVAGIDQGGNVSTEVDGSSKHVLFQQGIISRVQVVKVYRPWKNNV